MSIQDALGRDWRQPLPAEYRAEHAKWDNRSERIAVAYGMIGRFLPEYTQTGSPRSVLDVSCGAGSFLEVMRHYGHEILGVDIQYFPFLESQEIPYIVHNCSQFPYPFEDDSFDLVTCIGSISTYGVPWESVLAEFFRISRECVFLSCNSGAPHNENASMLRALQPSGWKRTHAEDGRYKWVRE